MVLRHLGRMMEKPKRPGFPPVGAVNRADACKAPVIFPPRQDIRHRQHSASASNRSSALSDLGTSYSILSKCLGLCPGLLLHVDALKARRLPILLFRHNASLFSSIVSIKISILSVRYHFNGGSPIFLNRRAHGVCSGIPLTFLFSNSAPGTLSGFRRSTSEMRPRSALRIQTRPAWPHRTS